MEVFVTFLVLIFNVSANTSSIWNLKSIVKMLAPYKAYGMW